MNNLNGGGDESWDESGKMWQGGDLTADVIHGRDLVG